MAGDVLKASLWNEADVYVATSLTAADPASGEEWAALDYGLVGLLDGEDGFLAALEKRLGIPVVETVAVKREGAAPLLARLDAALPPAPEVGDASERRTIADFDRRHQ